MNCKDQQQYILIKNENVEFTKHSVDETTYSTHHGCTKKTISNERSIVGVIWDSIVNDIYERRLLKNSRLFRARNVNGATIVDLDHQVKILTIYTILNSFLIILIFS